MGELEKSQPLVSYINISTKLATYQPWSEESHNNNKNKTNSCHYREMDFKCRLSLCATMAVSSEVLYMLHKAYTFID